MRRIALLLALSVSLLASSARAANWNLVFEDNFDRAELGSNWEVLRGSLTIDDGQLKLLGSGAQALITRPFVPDVRLEFDCTANPDAPPCDLSCTVYASPQTGYTYLFAFGGNNNRLNQLRGPGISIVDKNPPFLIEPGKSYHMIATREGRELSYEVNDTVILEGTCEDLMGGPDFDRVGFVTWNGMLIDNVKVFERSEPHPDTPVYLTNLPPLPLVREGRTVRYREGQPPASVADALQALNDGRFDVARQRFESLRDPILRLSGLLHLLCDPRYEETRDDFANLADEWSAAAKSHPENKAFRGFLPAMRIFRVMVHDRGRLREAATLMNIGPDNNPFYYKAKMMRGRIQYMHSMEGGFGKMRNSARQWLAELLEIWPEVDLLREYTGEPVLWGEEWMADTTQHPRWAALLREAYCRQVALIDRWIEHRQQPDGQLGGGWGDDVEILRSWVPVAAISTGATVARDGITRLADGVWKYATTNGYENGIGDVEHSSEPSADAFPVMMLLHPGDPRYVEWNLRSAKTITGFFGRDDKGYRRLMSNEVGAGGINRQWQAGGDTPYTARMMKHFIWLGEFGNTEARDFFVDWADGWRYWTMKELPDKPAGIAPETIWYPTGTITPPNGKPWYDVKSNYYGSWDITPGMIFDSFLSAYHLTGDKKFLEPLEAARDYPQIGVRSLWDQEAGSDKWLSARVYNQMLPERTGTWHLLTGSWPIDRSILNDPAKAIDQINKNLQGVEQEMNSILGQLRYNIHFQTTEVMATDRSALPGGILTWRDYTGAYLSTRDAYCPTWHVTYETPDTNFASYTRYVTPEQVRLVMYSFWEKPEKIGIRFWRLKPGRYTLRQGRILNDRFEWLPERTVEVSHMYERVPVVLAPQESTIVDIMLEEPIEIPGVLTDLAIARRDLKVGEDDLHLVVHNLGSKESGPFKVSLQVFRNGKWVTQASSSQESLAPPEDFTHSTRMVNLPYSAEGPGVRTRVIVEPADGVYEITLENNIVELPPTN